MASKLTVVISQGQSSNPAKRKLEEDLVGSLLFEPGVEVTVIPHLYDLAPDGTGMLCLRGISGEMVVLSWLFPRAAHWILDRNGIRGNVGQVLLVGEEEENDPAEEQSDSETTAEASEKNSPLTILSQVAPSRKIYCLDLRVSEKIEDFLQEIRRIRDESSVQTVSLNLDLGGTFAPPQIKTSTESGGLLRFPMSKENSFDNSNGENGHAISAATPSLNEISSESTIQPGGPIRVEEATTRRWYPVIDFSRCTNCLECIDFCLFGVYGVNEAEHILVEQPDNCRKGCPACSRVCPENAILFPQHKSPGIAGGAEGVGGSLKIDLSLLFGGGLDSVETAVRERDVELVAAGRDAVGMSVGIPKRQDEKTDQPKDKLDQLMDQLEEMDL